MSHINGVCVFDFFFFAAVLTFYFGACLKNRFLVLHGILYTRACCGTFSFYFYFYLFYVTLFRGLCRFKGMNER
ncbi:hypothetical protein BDV26DRAFT_141892 [Aspergillus bertholletiae]|uniref:Uncharacterized protein n=1 Tax=Aspergillus bertholletiae TaxID=1226010 RepID=A0A5N7BEP5_9EURO|nr:hypothetical protein BDV26DRAFT_141892 [Aspergillus bertholletiae]